MIIDSGFKVIHGRGWRAMGVRVRAAERSPGMAARIRRLFEPGRARRVAVRPLRGPSQTMRTELPIISGVSCSGVRYSTCFAARTRVMKRFMSSARTVIGVPAGAPLRKRYCRVGVRRITGSRAVRVE